MNKNLKDRVAIHATQGGGTKLNIEPKKINKRPVIAGLIVFVALLILTQYVSYQRYLLLKDTNEREVRNQAILANERMQTVMRNCFSITQTLAFIIEQQGMPDNLDALLKSLLEKRQNIDVVEIVRGGVITYAYPLKGNEAIIGYNILEDSVGNSGAFTAIKNRDFFVSGPINLHQGGTGIVGRSPIFINNEFWGFSAAVVKMPTLLSAMRIDTTADVNFFYQMSKVNPNTGKEVFFLPGDTSLRDNFFVPLEVLDGEWKLYVVSENDNLLLFVATFVVLGFIISVIGGLFTWYISERPERLNTLVDAKTVLLSASENNYRNTLERVSDAFVALDKNWCYTFMNKKAGEIFGRNPETMIGKNIWTEFPADVDKAFYKAYHKSVDEQKYIFLEEYYAPNDLWFENHIYPSQNGLSIFFRDITERKKSEKKVRLLTERLQLATRANNTGIWDWDIVKNVLVWDETMYKVYGISPEKFTGAYEAWANSIHPDDAVRSDNDLQKALRGEGKYDSEYRVIWEDGSVHYIKADAFIQRDASDNPIRMIGTNWDITKLKLTEEELLRKNDELVKSNTELDRFVYSVSHDLRAPLTSMLGLISLANENLLPDQHELKGQLEMMQRSVIRLDNFIQDILNYSRNARREIVKEEILIENIIQETREQLKFMEGRLENKVELDIDQKSKFISDKERIAVVLNNLLSNAFKYQDVSKKEPFVKVTFRADKKEAVLTIEDNGIGISEKEHSKIFEMFYRGTTVSHGSGLGMYIAKESIEKLSGTIRLESEVRKGSKFIITLPNLA